MHKSSMIRMQWFVDRYLSIISKDKVTVLDVGSFDVNGSYRPLFQAPKYHYTGLDMVAGPNVDVVLESPYDWSALASDSFDVVISGQAFEHIEFFWKTMEEMVRVLRKDGFLCLIAPNRSGEHRYPVDCYRFFADGMIALARYTGIRPLHAHTNCAPSAGDAAWYGGRLADSMLVARKPFTGPPRHPNFSTYKCVPVDLRGEMVPYNRKDSLRRIVRRMLRGLK